MEIPSRIGLSLSGGGYRAAAFHLGTLNKLEELKILSNVNVISTISGGSITGAYYCLEKDNYDLFKKNLYDILQTKNVITKVFFSFMFLKFLLFSVVFLVLAFYFLFTSLAWLFPVILTIFIFLLLRFQFYIFPVSKQIEKIYNDIFFSGKNLGQLPVDPILVIGSTNLQTARPFTFSRDWMQDSTYQYLENPVRFKSFDFPISRAVMASSSVPFAFTPVRIDKKYFLKEEDADTIHPLLVDGGVYDNQGIHKIMQGGTYTCSHIIVSDAGGFNSGELRLRNTITLLLATVNVFMSRIKKMQMVFDVYENAATAKKQVAYFSLGWDIENCILGFIDNLKKGQITQSVIDAHHLAPEWVKDPQKFEVEISEYMKLKTNYELIDKPTEYEKNIARKIHTNLTSLSKRQVDCLIKQAAGFTEIQVKLYCPSLISNYESK